MSRVLPIFFNTEMVKAILDGRKTVTRIKSTYREPYKPGDILYVRETWSFIPCIECTGSDCCYKTPAYYEDKEVESIGCYIYRSGFPEYADSKRITWRPSIHMPKAAARIWLKVTDVRVERLQDITEQQAEAEGLYKDWSLAPEFSTAVTARQAFMWLWNTTIKRYRDSWLGNPWVWVIEFESCEKPEPCIIRGVEPADDERPCIGYGVSEDDDEPCEMCKGCKAYSGNDEEAL